MLRADAVVMEMEKVSASARGAVAMEIPLAAASLSVARAEAEKQREPELPFQNRGQHHRTRPPFNNGRFYLLIVIGEISTDHHLQAAKKHIKQGLRSWDINLNLCNLDSELQFFNTHHSAQFSSEVKGQSCFGPMVIVWGCTIETNSGDGHDIEEST
ncbi:hypothetical protein DPEC_G00253130 [Dallia pectoralis]|uniref:Uncharacterized protein n=1 Tax=Dallia pectoralis TaxID=75939 RepID=A0ACC2FTW3_DALPE|nr:hypothetical protein DPEC_G00253130 [Dallia pectoralis]